MDVMVFFADIGVYQLEFSCPKGDRASFQNGCGVGLNRALQLGMSTGFPGFIPHFCFECFAADAPSLL